MMKYKPLRTALLGYEIIRIAMLSLMFAYCFPLEGATQIGNFPYIAYLTPNALFPLMALFFFISLAEYRIFLPLYLAGKTIMLITFYVWSAVYLRPAMNEPLMGLSPEKYANGIVLLLGSFVLGFGDTLSILGSWFLIRKTRHIRPDDAGETGGLQ